MIITVRNENPKDYRRVEELARNAFWNLYFPGCDEHFVIHKMRDHEDFIKDLAFVIEVDGTVQGGIFYTHSHIVSEDGTKHKTISFGPVFIAPEFHRQGLGRKLIEHSIEAAKKGGYTAILTLGYPYHYEPYGFLSGKNYHISMPDGKFYIGLLVLPLYKGALDNISGYADFSNVFDICQEDVNLFDQNFPYKEKKYQKSQDEFQIASTTLDA